MNKVSFVIILITLAASCTESRNSEELENKYFQLIQESNMSYTLLSNFNYSIIGERLKVLSYGQRVSDVYKVAIGLKEMTKKVIDSLENYSKIESNDRNEYVSELKKNYVKYLKTNDTLLSRKLATELYEFENSTLSSGLSNDEVLNSILQLESLISTDLVNRIGMIDHMTSKISFLVSSDRTYYKVGDSVKIQVGIGSYSDAANPTFVVAGLELKKENGYGIGVFSADGIGKKIIPIRIMYDSLDGARRSYNTTIEYLVE